MLVCQGYALAPAQITELSSLKGGQYIAVHQGPKRISISKAGGAGPGTFESAFRQKPLLVNTRFPPGQVGVFLLIKTNIVNSAHCFYGTSLSCHRVHFAYKY